MKTDTQLQQDVLAELQWEPSVNAAAIGVEVTDGIVTLSGHVDSHGEKWGAENAAQRVAGVKGLAVDIHVNLPPLSQRTDADIARTARNVLEWTTYLPREAVKVMVEGGWITLSGTVEWEYQRHMAAAAVRHLLGVTGVSDELALKPMVSATAVKSDIEASFTRRAHSDARKVSVDVSGTLVTLTGTVGSWAEHELARHSAWGTPGVRSVVDNIVVS
jgi:osmotically-inducible protein OsmY